MKLIKATYQGKEEFGLLYEAGEHDGINPQWPRYSSLEEAYNDWEDGENTYFAPVPNNFNWEEIERGDLPHKSQEKYSEIIDFFLAEPKRCKSCGQIIEPGDDTGQGICMDCFEAAFMERRETK